LIKLLENPEQFLTAILIGNNVVNISASVLATDAALGFFGETGLAIATGIMTLFILVFGEIFPKTLASRNAENISLHVAIPITMIIKIFRPIVRFLTTIINFMILLFGGGLVFLIGVWDDLKPTKQMIRLIGGMVAGVLLILLGHRINGFPLISIPLTIFYVVGAPGDPGISPIRCCGNLLPAA